MFNGIIFNTGKVISIEKSKKSIFIGIFTNTIFKKKDLGSSISCDGVCLTLVKIHNKKIYFYLSNETLKRSNFRSVKINQIINLEKSLSYGKKISGHYIPRGIAKLNERLPEGKQLHCFLILKILEIFVKYTLLALSKGTQ